MELRSVARELTAPYVCGAGAAEKGVWVNTQKPKVRDGRMSVGGALLSSAY